MISSFLRATWPYENLGMYEEGILGSWREKEWKNISPTSWPCLRMTSPETHIVFLVSLSFPGPDYPGHHHHYGDLGIGAIGVGESWEASQSLTWSRLWANFLWKAYVPTLSLYPLTQSQMGTQVCFTCRKSSIHPLFQASPSTSYLIENLSRHVQGGKYHRGSDPWATRAKNNPMFWPTHMLTGSSGL